MLDLFSKAKTNAQQNENFTISLIQFIESIIPTEEDIDDVDLFDESYLSSLRLSFCTKIVSKILWSTIYLLLLCL